MFNEHTNIVPPDNPCVICNKLAKYYNTLWYIHICTEECYDAFIKKAHEEIIQIERLDKDE